MASNTAEAMRRLTQKTESLPCGDDQDAEHQVGLHLGRTPHPHMTPATGIFQGTVDPLRLAARLVPLGLMRRKFDLLPSPWVMVDRPSWRDTSRMIPPQ